MEKLYVVLMEDLLLDPEFNSIDKIVWQANYKYCQPKDKAKKIEGKTTVGQKRLSQDLGVTVPTISISTTKPEKKGWISIDYRRGKTSEVTLHYERKPKE